MLSGVAVSIGSACTPSGPVPVLSFSPLAPVHVVSPLQLAKFQAELRDYPDQAAASYVMTGLRDGFRIGFEASSVSLRSASANMSSALVHPSFIDAYLDRGLVREGGRPVYYLALARVTHQPFWGYSEEQSTGSMAFDS